MRIARIMSILVLSSMVISSGWAADNAQSQKKISGKIVDVDHAGSIITVRYVDSAGSVDEINIIVPDDAEVLNGTKIKSFYDVQQLDPVVVTYYDDGVSGLKAVRIADLNQANR
ncbi:MAG: hypothetical protein PHS66_02170 [Candidatus Omnitrophica bacterium]|nr:hypothetical protein [Candidatus Omnitrophota bacterium]